MNSLIKGFTEVNGAKLPVIYYKDQPVVTTSTLATMYEVDTVRIRQNFSKNEEYFTEGEHLFMLKGADLRDFKEIHRVASDYSVEIGPRVNKLALWTEKGAARHAKILETKKAWGVFTKLENFYFDNRNFVEDKSPSHRCVPAPPDSALPKDTPEGAVAEFVANFYSECIDSGADLILANKYVAGFHYVFEKGVQTGKASAPRLAAPSDLDVDDRGYSHQTTLADAVDVPTKDFSGKRRSIPYLLRDAGLLDDGRRLTTLGEQYGEKRRVNGRPRLCWHIVRTSEYLTDWMAKNDW